MIELGTRLFYSKLATLQVLLLKIKYAAEM